MDSAAGLGPEAEKAAQGALAQDSNSYVVLPNRQSSTRPVVPRHNTSGMFACRLEQEVVGEKRAWSFTEVQVDSGI